LSKYPSIRNGLRTHTRRFVEPHHARLRDADAPRLAEQVAVASASDGPASVDP
jgi:hypothetical protein